MRCSCSPPTASSARRSTPSGWRRGELGDRHASTATASPADFVLAPRRPNARSLRSPRVLSWVRTLARGARAAGGREPGAMEHAEAYARDRIQFGQPIGAVRVADPAARTDAADRGVGLPG